MQHNWNVNIVMKCLKVFLQWRLDMTQNRCLNAVVQNKAFVSSSNLILHSPYWMFENAWLKPDCRYGPCSSLLSGNLTVQRRFWSWRKEKLNSSRAGSLSCRDTRRLLGDPAPLCSTELIPSQGVLAGTLHSGNVLGILFFSKVMLDSSFSCLKEDSTILYKLSSPSGKGQ